MINRYYKIQKHILKRNDLSAYDIFPVGGENGDLYFNDLNTSKFKFFITFVSLIYGKSCIKFSTYLNYTTLFYKF